MSNNKNTIFVGLGEKGGVGKSTGTEHFVSAYLQQKYRGQGSAKIIPFYEIDAHNRSFEDVENDDYLQYTLVGKDREEIERAIAEIEFDSMEKDIIIDVGGSDNTERFLTAVSGKAIIEKMIFIVPEGKQGDSSSLNTVWKIREHINMDAKIIIALNRHNRDPEITKEKDFPRIFGSESYSIEPSKLLTDDKIHLATIPECEILLGFCLEEKITIWSLGEDWRDFGGLSPEQRMKKWADKGKEKCEKDVFIKNTLNLNKSQLAMSVLDDASEFFDILGELHDQ